MGFVSKIHEKIITITPTIGIIFSFHDGFFFNNSIPSTPGTVGAIMVDRWKFAQAILPVQIHKPLPVIHRGELRECQSHG